MEQNEERCPKDIPLDEVGTGRSSKYPIVYLPPKRQSHEIVHNGQVTSGGDPIPTLQGGGGNGAEEMGQFTETTNADGNISRASDVTKDKDDPEGEEEVKKAECQAAQVILCDSGKTFGWKHCTKKGRGDIICWRATNC